MLLGWANRWEQGGASARAGACALGWLRSSLAFCLTLCLFCIPALAQHIPLQRFGEEQGLDNLAIIASLKDQQGVLWVATNSGLFRYDGLRFHFEDKESGLPEGDVAPLTMDDSGLIWAGSRKGLFYGGSHGFHRVEGVQLQMGFGGSTQIVPGASNELLVVVAGRLYSIQKESLAGKVHWVADEYAHRHPGFPALSHIHIVRQTGQDLWLASGSGIYHWSHGKMQSWGPQEGVPEDQYLGFRLLSNGQMWVRSQKFLLSLEPGGGWKNAADQIHLPNLLTRFGPMAEDHLGQLLTTSGNHLLLYNPHEKMWKVFGPREGLPEFDLSSLYVDPSGGIWLGTQGAGLYRWKGYPQWQSYTEHEGLPNSSTWQMASSPDHTLVVATNTGLAQHTPGSQSWTTLPAVHESCSMYGTAVTDDGSVWYACGQTLYRHSLKSAAQDRFTLPTSTNISYMLVMRGKLWMATLHGLYWINTTGPDHSVHPMEWIGDQRIGQLVVGQHQDLWASGSRGIYRIQPDDGKSELVMPAPLRPNGFPLVMDWQGNLWFGSVGEGLNRARLVAGKVVGIDSYNRPTLHSRQIYSILADHRGWIWCGGDAGLEVFHDGKWSFLNSSNGLISNDPNEGALFEDRDGSIWIGTSGGISHLLKPEAALQTYPASVQILSILVNGQEQPIRDSLSVPSGKGVVELQVGSSEHEQMPGVLLMYRSPGSMEHWSLLGESLLRVSQSTPRVLNLEFELMAPDGTPVSKLVKLHLEVRPAWWRSPLAFCFYAMALSGLLVLAWHMRTRQLLLAQKNLEEIVECRTLELADKNRALEQARKELEYKASHDSLTGLMNRSALFDLLLREIQRANREGSALVVTILDLDHFKRINDSFGHPVGDAVLIEVCQRLQATLRAYDAMGRYGGEEFTILLPGLNPDDAMQRLEQLRISLAAKPVLVDDIVVQVSASFGYTNFKPGDQAASLLQRADAALYQAKASGRNRVCFVDEVEPDSGI